MKYRFGGFWCRASACFIDEVILMFVLFTIFLVGLMALWIGFPLEYRELLLGGILELGGMFIGSYFLMIVLTHMLYYTYFHGTTGQTPGKMLLKLRVIRTTGEEMTLGFGFLRWTAYFVSAVFFGLGLLWIVFDRKKQGWHDKIAGTLVIHPSATDREPENPRDEKYLDKESEIL